MLISKLNEVIMNFNSQNPILSIEVLTSNRKDTITKCLDSLSSLRKNVPSELIIVDTGCDWEMLDIVSKYTDKIVRFEWRDDFAAARNAGLDRASGKWFMFLDDDEWFEDTKEIENYFNGGYYKEFNACWYVQRNYVDMSGTGYGDILVARMVRLDEGVRFKGRIHEYLTYTGDYTTVGSFVHHYGYVFTSDESRYRHFERNASLLKQMIVEERDDLRWWLQLVQEYMNIGEYEKSKNLCSDALKQFKEADDYNTRRNIAYFYVARMDADLRTYRFADALEYGEQALTDSRLYQMAQADIYRRIARAAFETEQYDKATSSASEYLRIYDALIDDETAKVEQMSSFCADVLEEKSYSEVCWILIDIGIHEGNSDNIIKNFERLHFSGSAVYMYKDDDIQRFVDAISTWKLDVWCIEAVKKIVAKGLADRCIEALKKIGSEMEPVLDDGMESSESHCNIDEEQSGNKIVSASDVNMSAKLKFINLLTMLLANGVSDDYIDFWKIKLLDENSNITISSQDVLTSTRKLLDSKYKGLLCDSLFWGNVFSSGVSIESLFAGTEYATWMELVEDMCRGS